MKTLEKSWLVVSVFALLWMFAALLFVLHMVVMK